jgi:hypothetical protein
MLYMLLAVPGSRLAGPAPGMSMPGMGGSAGAWKLPALAVVLALFMVGYVVWAADQITSPAGRRTAGVAPGAASAPGSGNDDRAGGPVLAPRLAAFSKISMSMTMGYMLVLML